MITMEELLRTMVERGGSDLHISAGAPPKSRIDGDLAELSGRHDAARWRRRDRVTVIEWARDGDGGSAMKVERFKRATRVEERVLRRVEERVMSHASRAPDLTLLSET